MVSFCTQKRHLLHEAVDDVACFAGKFWGLYLQVYERCCKLAACLVLHADAAMASHVASVYASRMRYTIPVGFCQSCVACLQQPVREASKTRLERWTLSREQNNTLSVQTGLSLACPTFATRQHGVSVVVKSPVLCQAECLCSFTGPGIR